MIKISGYELFSSMVIFQLGTTIIFGFAAGAGRDAWIVVLISTILGATIIWGYTLLTRLNGGASLVEWFTASFGKWLGTPVAWLYPMIFTYDAGRGLNDLKFLIPVTILPGTPVWAVLSVFLLVILYALFGGLEVICRITGIILPVFICLFVLEIVLMWGSGALHLVNLAPVLGEGWGRVWSNVFPLGIMQTYGETIEFAMFWIYLNQKGKVGKTSVRAALFSGCFIMIFDILAISGLTEGVFQQMNFPTFSLLKLSNVGDFLENLDALGVMYFIFTAFVKLTLHLFAAVFCVQKLASVSGNRVIILVVWSVAFLMGMTMATSLPEHMEAGLKALQMQIWVPLFLVLPGLALAVTLVKKGLEAARR